jgi:hypothetical protein
MVNSISRSTSCSKIQENFQIHLRSIRVKFISSLRTKRRPKQSHRRSSTLQMMTAAGDSFLFKPLKRSLSLCSLTSDEYISDDEIEPWQMNETGYQDISTRRTMSSTTPKMNSPKAPTPSLRMRPSPCSGCIFENLPFLSLIVHPTPNFLYDSYPESSPIDVTKNESTLASDFTDDEGSSLSYMPEYERNATTPDVDLHDTILDTPKSCYLRNPTHSVSPPPLRATKRYTIYSDAFENDLATNHSLFLPDGF